jgi:hypothetical protein
VLHQDIGQIEGIERAKRPQRLPVVHHDLHARHGQTRRRRPKPVGRLSEGYHMVGSLSLTPL